VAVADTARSWRPTTTPRSRPSCNDGNASRSRRPVASRRGGRIGEVEAARFESLNIGRDVGSIRWASAWPRVARCSADTSVPRGLSGGARRKVICVHGTREVHDPKDKHDQYRQRECQFDQRRRAALSRFASSCGHGFILEHTLRLNPQTCSLENTDGYWPVVLIHALPFRMIEDGAPIYVVHGITGVYVADVCTCT
jgi:hypothetical protein